MRISFSIGSQYASASEAQFVWGGVCNGSECVQSRQQETDQKKVVCAPGRGFTRHWICPVSGRVLTEFAGLEGFLVWLREKRENQSLISSVDTFLCSDINLLVGFILAA